MAAFHHTRCFAKNRRSCFLGTNITCEKDVKETLLRVSTQFNDALIESYGMLLKAQLGEQFHDLRRLLRVLYYFRRKVTHYEQ